VYLAVLGGGEALLVHGGAGGVGMAALQIAAHLGVEVFATAHPDKWGALRDLGLDDAHIASSRSLEFKEKFLEVTGGSGVDVVLDSLAGEFVDASLGLLPRGGRFIEMGKTDIRDPDRIAAEHGGVRYRAFDLQEAGPDRIQEMLGELVGLFGRGVLRPLPVRRFDVRRAPEAFRFMREARHVGKIVLGVPQALDREGTVLVTGGTGGLGAVVARHLAGVHGVRSLLLVSRSGEEAEGAAELQRSLEELGCQVRIAACDVSHRAELERLLAEIPEEHPLSTVIHAAGVLDDGVIASLDAGRLRRVMAAKVDAAINLHELTEGMGLGEMIFFSSGAGTLGSPGQANYAAANAFLDALAYYRRARGLPGLSLAWGAWERATRMTTALTDIDRARLARQGVSTLTDSQGLELLDAARAIDEPLLLPVCLDTAALRAQSRAGLLPPILSSLIGAPARSASNAKGSLARRLSAAPESDWDTIVLELVKSHVANVLGHASAEAIDPQRAFKDLGFDSLSAVELRNRLIHATGAKLPATLVFDHPTPIAVAGFLKSEVVGRRREVELEPDEVSIRAAFPTIPFARLRRAGLVMPLLELIHSDDDEDDRNGDTDSLDTMDAASLIRRVKQQAIGSNDRGS
jgi:NADPH:quinone reductase-like Zn-dependent oxidoreductase/acyl carrier protein